jgi:microsomal dipeptidase-like Zn-dependent dipeptidase
MSKVGPYPVFISHGHPRAQAEEKIAHTEKSTPDWVLDFIKQNGGVFGLRPGADEMKDYSSSGVPNDCAGSTKSFAQALAYLVDKGLPVAFASDMNGGTGVFNLVPRFIDTTDVETERRTKRAACLGNESQQAQQSNLLGDDPSTQYVDEQDFNYKGLAHIGLVPAVVQDLKENGLQKKYQDALWESAEKVIQMWEKIQ